MKYKFCSICINVTKYDVTFAQKAGSNPLPPVATPLLAAANTTQARDGYLINVHVAAV